MQKKFVVKVKEGGKMWKNCIILFLCEEKSILQLDISCNILTYYCRGKTVFDFTVKYEHNKVSDMYTLVDS